MMKLDELTKLTTEQMKIVNETIEAYKKLCEEAETAQLDKLERCEKFIKKLFHYMRDMKDKLHDPQEMHSGFYSLGCIMTRIGMFIEKEYLEQESDEKDI